MEQNKRFDSWRLEIRWLAWTQRRRRRTTRPVWLLRNTAAYVGHLPREAERRPWRGRMQTMHPSRQLRRSEQNNHTSIFWLLTISRREPLHQIPDDEVSNVSAIVKHSEFLFFRAPYKYSYLLTYLLTNSHQYVQKLKKTTIVVVWCSGGELVSSLDQLC